MDSDDALLARLAKDLDGAFPDLVAAHAGRLYTIAHRCLGVPADAEEVAQDALVRAHAALTGYDPERIRALKLRAWLARITVNLARNRRRRASDRRPATSLDPLVDAGAEPRLAAHAGPVEIAERRDEGRRLALALLRLRPGVREAIVLRHVDGLSVAETAAALGRPEGTIKAQVHRGLADLRHFLTTDLLDQLDRSSAGRELTA
jgi:RNA polymerase sigma-70 factor (ECF subfamily)